MERKVRQVQLKGCVFQTTQLHIKCHLTMSKFQCSLHLANFFAKWAKLCDCQFQKCIKHEHCGERGFQTLFDDCTIILFEAYWCLYTTKLLGLVRWSYFSMRMHCSHCSIYILLSLSAEVLTRHEHCKNNCKELQSSYLDPFPYASP